ncbi:MAG: hydroxyacid dehydrogenase, partial [Haloechinothrix sp.]
AKGVRAGLDVLADEPGQGTGAIDSRLARHPNVYGTHHIGASTEQAQEAIGAEVVRMVAAFESGEVLHCVNPDAGITAAVPRDRFATTLRTGHCP